MLSSVGCGCLKNKISIGNVRYLTALVSNPQLMVRNNHLDIKNSKELHNRHTTSAYSHQVKYISSSQLSVIFQKRSISTEKNEKITKESKFLTIPNVLTGLRLLGAPYIGYLVFCQEFNWALGLFIAAAITDSVDGWIARNFKGQSSIFGAFIDPLADKVLVSILTFSLTYAGIIPTPLCVMIILRDLMIMSTAAHFHYKHLEYPKTMKRYFDFENSKVQMEPTLISKYNTFFQLGLVAISLTAPVVGFVDHPYLHAYWYLVGSTTVLSGLSYIVKDKSAYFVK